LNARDGGAIQGAFKIFRTEAVKFIKLTIRPIGRHHPRSSFLPHVNTGPTVSFIFGTLPGCSFLSVSSTLCDSAWISSMASNRRPFSFSFIFGKKEEVAGCQIRGVRWMGDKSQLVFRQKMLGEGESVGWGEVMVKQPGLFSPKFGATSSHVFTQSPLNVAVEPGIHSLACWDRCFALPQLLYRWRHQSGIFWIAPRIKKGLQISLPRIEIATFISMGHAVAQWLRHCATNRFHSR
jgi:hypothetical protein